MKTTSVLVEVCGVSGRTCASDQLIFPMTLTLRFACRQVWNDNMSFDELIGTCLIRLPRERTALGDAVWFPLNTGISYLPACLRACLFSLPARSC